MRRIKDMKTKKFFIFINKKSIFLKTTRDFVMQYNNVL